MLARIQVMNLAEDIVNGMLCHAQPSSVAPVLGRT